MLADTDGYKGSQTAPVLKRVLAKKRITLKDISRIT